MTDTETKIKDVLTGNTGNTEAVVKSKAEYTDGPNRKSFTVDVNNIPVHLRRIKKG